MIAAAATTGHRIRLFGTLLIACILSAPPTDAQSTDRTVSATPDSITLLQSAIERRTLERDRLTRILAALNEVDTVYKPLYPAWRVLDDDLRERVHRAFRFHGSAPLRDADVMIIADTARGEILELAMGDVHMGRLQTRQILSDELFGEILRGTYQRTPVDIAITPLRSNVLEESPRFAALTVSAFAIRLLFAGDIGIETTVGREEIGYHFWSSGDFNVRFLLKGFKAGILLPFPYGYKTTRTSAPLAIRPTLLTGSTGFSGEFEQPFGKYRVGARLSVGELYLRNFIVKVPDSLSAYSLHTTAQAYGAYETRWGDDQFRFTGGIGFHQVTQNTADNHLAKVTTLDKQNFSSPLLRVDYTRLGNRMYGGTLQYYSGILFLAGWVEVVQNFLFLDLKYYSPVFRDPQPWEQRYFFMVSPRLQITY